MASSITLTVTDTGITPAAASITRDSSLTITLNGLADVGEAITGGKLHVKAFDALGDIIGDDAYAVSASVTASIRDGACSLFFFIVANDAHVIANGGPVAVLPEFPIEIDEAGGGGGSNTMAIYFGKEYKAVASEYMDSITFDTTVGDPLPQNIKEMRATYTGGITSSSSAPKVNSMTLNYYAESDSWDTFLTYIEPVSSTSAKQRSVPGDISINMETEGEITLTPGGTESVVNDNYYSWVLVVVSE